MPSAPLLRRPLAAVALAAAALGAGVHAAPSFGDATDAAGIRFLHAGYDAGEPWFIEAIGSGACWGDVDRDGFDDLYLVNQRYVNGSGNALYDPHHALYLNEGDGTFRDASAEARVDGRGWGTGCSFADVEGDGDLDLLVTWFGGLTLYVNEGHGRFHDGTAAAHLSLEGLCGVDIRCWATGSAWADYDRDGDLDLYVANYVDWDPDTNDHGNSPGVYNGQPNVLFRNRGDGTFEDATAEAGVGDDPGPNHSKSFQPVWFDHDRDGWPDLYIASDTTANTLFLNLRDGTFRDVAAAAGVADDRSSMGLAIDDFTGDGRDDLFMTHYEGEYSGLYEARADGTYRDRSPELGAELDDVGWGAGFHDFDHDGDLDLYGVNGHTHPDSNWFEQAPHYYENAGGQWLDRSAEAGPAFQNKTVSRGSAAADYDADGDLDLVQANAFNRTARLFRHGGAAGNWLQVELRQPGANPSAVGARLEAILPEGSVLLRTVRAGSSFLSQDSVVLHLGLGTAGAADLQVTWPDGGRERAEGVGPGQRLRWERGQGLVNDTLAPRTRLDATGPAGSEGWFTGPVQVALAAEDRGVSWRSGLARTLVRVDGGPWAAYAGPLRLDRDGVHGVEGRSGDRAGNEEPPRARTVRIDSLPPATRAELRGLAAHGGWYAGTVRVDLVARDATSGVAGTFHQLEGGGLVLGDALEVREDGRHEVRFLSQDRAGNVEPLRSAVVPIDRRPPWLHLPALSVAGPWGGGVAPLAGDDTSGLARLSYYLDRGAAPAAVREGPHGWAWRPPPGTVAPGLHEVRVVAEDRAGHAAEASGWLLVAPG